MLFQVANDAMQMGLHKTPCPFYTTKNFKTRQSKYSLALAHSEVRNKPYVYFHKPASITSHEVCKKKTA